MHGGMGHLTTGSSKQLTWSSHYRVQAQTCAMPTSITPRTPLPLPGTLLEYYSVCPALVIVLVIRIAPAGPPTSPAPGTPFFIGPNENRPLGSWGESCGRIIGSLAYRSEIRTRTYSILSKWGCAWHDYMGPHALSLFFSLHTSCWLQAPCTSPISSVSSHRFVAALFNAFPAVIDFCAQL